MAFEIKQLGKLFQMGGLTLPEGGVVGVDLGSSSVKVVQLKMGHSGAALETYGELALGPYARLEIGRSVDLDQRQLTEAIVDIMREANVTSRNAALAISYTASIVIIVSIPTKDESLIASMVPVEARKYVPVPMGEVTLDWFVIPETDSAHAESGTRILLAAIYNEALKQNIKVVGQAGLLSAFTEIEAFSTIRSAVHEDDENVMVIDYGAGSVKLYIVESGVLYETHRIQHGAQDLTVALSKGMKISVAEAEELKRQIGLRVDAYDPRIREILLAATSAMLSETRRVFDRYESRRQKKVGKIILSGGGALLHGLDGVVKEMFGCTTAIADPFSKVEYPAFLENTLREAGPSFAVALGVALRRLSQ